MDLPIVSVIIPVYNAQKYLRQCLDTVMAQTLKEIEVICVDAGSEDDSLEILREYAQGDSRITVLSGYGRLDAGSARNLGLEIARGTYLSFLDADDCFHDTMLEKASSKMAQEGADIIVFWAQERNMRTDTVRDMPWSMVLSNCPEGSPFSPRQMRERLFNSFQNWTWNKLFRTAFIREHQIVFQSVARTNDMAFTVQALAMAESISVLPEVLLTYRVGTGTSLQQTNSSSPTSFWEAFVETKHRLEAAGLYEMYHQSYANKVVAGVAYNLHSVKTSRSRTAIMKRIRSEAGEFDLLKYPESYYYEPFQFRIYKDIVTAPFILFGYTPAAMVTMAKEACRDCVLRLMHKKKEE